jgi:hypothetical protein
MLAPDDDGDVVNTRLAQRAHLPLDQRDPAKLDKALRAISGRSVESAPLAGCQDDCAFDQLPSSK